MSGDATPSVFELLRSPIIIDPDPSFRYELPLYWRFTPAAPSNVRTPTRVSISVATEDSMTLAALFLIVPVREKSETEDERYVPAGPTESTVVLLACRFIPVLPSSVKAPAVVSISVAADDWMTLDAEFLIVPVRAKSETDPER